MTTMLTTRDNNTDGGSRMGQGSPRARGADGDVALSATDEDEASPRTRGADARLAALSAILTLVGVALGATRPSWLVDPLRGAVEGAGIAAPLAYVGLCVVAAPFHLNGLLMALSTAIWPLPVALLLSFIGSLTGCLLTAALLLRAGGATIGRRDAWPTWLRRLSAQVARRPLLVGLVARVALGSGMALEAFYLLTGYTRRQYLAVTIVGVAVWVTQTVVGVSLLHAALQISAGLAVAAAIVPVLIVPAIVVAVLAAVRRRRARQGA